MKRDQISREQAKNWKGNFKNEKRLTFNLKVPNLYLYNETYKKLAGENENRVRIYLGIEPEQEDGKYVLCAYAVASFLLGSGDVYVDYETPVFKIGATNIDCSAQNNKVIENIKRYKKWLAGNLDADNKYADVRQYIYPNAYLLTKYELHEIFNVQKKDKVKVEFGLSKKMQAMLSYRETDESGNTNEIVFDNMQLSPPNSDEGSIYNP